MNRIFVSALALMVMAAPAFAASTEPPQETVTTTVTTKASSVKTSTVEEPLKPEAGSRAIHFEDFDLDHDGKLTRAEAGEMLFRLYDTDGNMVVDDKEWLRPAVLSKSPIAKKTVTAYDDDNDGVADKVDATEERMTVDTMLSVYDKDGNGLSPEEFTGLTFNKADINRTNVIEKKEWQGVYDKKIDAKNRAEAALNR